MALNLNSVSFDGRVGMAKRPPPYESPLRRYPEYTQAMGILTIEIAALEMIMAESLAAILEVDVNTAEAIYLTPNGATVRVNILAHVAETRLVGFPHLLKKVNALVKRARAIFGKRDGLIHSAWLVHPTTKAVMTTKLGGRRSKTPPKLISSEAINRVARDVGALFTEVVELNGEIYSALKAWREKHPSPNRP